MTFDFEVENQDGSVLIRISGDVDIATAPKLVECIDNLIEQGHTDIRLDLQNVGYFDSQGVLVIVHALKRLQGHGVLTLYNPSRMAAKVLQLTKMDQVVRIR